MNTQPLEQQADQIESVLSQHQTPAICTGGNVTPRWVQFLMQPAPGVKADRVQALAGDIAQALGVRPVNITRKNGAVRINVPRADPQPVKLSKMLERLPVKRIPVATAVFGLADDGGPLLARLPSPEVRCIACPIEVAQTIFASLHELSKSRDVQLMTIGVSLPYAEAIGPAKLKGIIQRRERENFKDPRLVVGADVDRIGGGDLDFVLAHGFDRGAYVVGVSPAPSEDPAWGVVITRDDQAGDYIAHTSEGDIRFTLAEVDTV